MVMLQHRQRKSLSGHNDNLALGQRSTDEDDSSKGVNINGLDLAYSHESCHDSSLTLDLVL